uniref:Ribonuclease H-like domain-containing protein n=1 Tax=Tanacetum cinerariifolium TaxID=118510 RepID=A0A6L2K8I4_TANCI|nr:ribonuclease H-like domain-containing protein [Tanacetum cinerariifolium]
MKMEHYLSYTDYPIWQVIQNTNGHVSVTTDTNGIIKVLPPKTTEEVTARERERKARTTLLMALPKDHLPKFHKMADAKEIGEATKSRFSGNDKSKKMQKYLLKQQFEGFSVSTSEGLHKGYDRFLSSSWSQVALIMRTKPGLDTLSFDDLYNNLRVFERDVKGTTASSSNTQNVAFVSAENTSSTNNVSTAYSVSSPSYSKSQKEGSSSYIDEVIHSFLENQSSAPQLDYDDLEQINDDDMEEMDLKLQVAMISMRIKKFYKRTGRKLQFNTKDPAGHVEEDAQNYAMMAYSSSNSGFDNEVKSCSKACEESYARLKKLYDDQRDKLGDASVEITSYTLALKRKLLAEALKEKKDLKTKFENWQNSSKKHSKLHNTQMSANDKFGLGYGDYRYGSILSYENEVLQSVFINKASDLKDTPVNDRFINGMHAVPHPMTGNYMPSGPDVKIDYSKFTYGLQQTSADESDSKPSEYASCESDSNVKTSTSMPKPVENTSKDDPHRALKDKVDNGCSRHMRGNKAHLADYQEFKGGYIAFGGSNGRITGEDKIDMFKSCCTFWKTATFKTINNISQIHAKVIDKPVVITEASIRGDTLFNDADGIDCLTNMAIFENLALMGYEGDLTKLTF